MRICSFLPSGTEIVYGLGLGDSLYGVSHECDYPPEAMGKPKVVRSKFDPAQLTSAQIDTMVSEMFSRGERIYEVDQEVLNQAKPDLVITQELCDVCAISYEDVQQAVVHLDMPPTLVSLDPHGLSDVLGDIKRVGELTGTTTRASAMTAELQGRIESVRSSLARTQSRPKVACIEWLDPLIVAGHWIPEMVELAGGTDGLAQPGAPSRRIEMNELAASAPDVVVLMPCGMGVDQAVRELSLLDGLDQWEALPAVQKGRVYAADAGGLFSRSGPRLVEGVELMAQMVHPEVFTEPLPPSAARRLESLRIPG